MLTTEKNNFSKYEQFYVLNYRVISMLIFEVRIVNLFHLICRLFKKSKKDQPPDDSKPEVKDSKPPVGSQKLGQSNQYIIIIIIIITTTTTIDTYSTHDHYAVNSC